MICFHISNQVLDENVDSGYQVNGSLESWSTLICVGYYVFFPHHSVQVWEWFPSTLLGGILVQSWDQLFSIRVNKVHLVPNVFPALLY